MKKLGPQDVKYLWPTKLSDILILAVNILYDALSAQVFAGIAGKSSQQRAERRASRSTSETSSGVASPVGGTGFFAKSSSGKSSLQRNSTSTGGASGFFSKSTCVSRQGADNSFSYKVRCCTYSIEAMLRCAVLCRNYRPP